MKNFYCPFFPIFTLVMIAQNVFVIFNGDSISLWLTSNGANTKVGNIQDIQNKYDVFGTINNNTFSGQVIGPKLGLQFMISVTIYSNVFNAIFTFDYLGEKLDMNVFFIKKKSLAKLLLHTNQDKNSSRFVNSITFVGK